MKRISGYIREIPGGDPVLNIPVTIKDALTGTNIPVGGLYGGSTNPVNTDNVTGYFEWNTELDPGPVRIEAVPGVGIKKVRSSLEQTSAFGVWISDIPEYFKVFSNGVVAGQGNQFNATSSGLNVTLRDGEAIVGGRFWKTSTNRGFTAGSNVTLTERWDALILRQHIGGTAQGRQEIVLVPGTVNATLPTLNTDPNKVDSLLWTVKVANGASVVTLVDSRSYTKYTNPANSVTPSMLSTEGANSTSALAKVYKAPISGNTPTVDTLSTRVLSDVADIAPTVGQILAWDNLTSMWLPVNLSIVKPITKNSNTVILTSTDVYDFASYFAVSEGPAGEANIGINVGGIVDNMLGNNISATHIGSGNVTSTEFNTLDGIGGVAISAQLAAKSSTSHTHTAKDTVSGSNVAGYSFHAVNTTLVTINSFNLGPLENGVVYDVYAKVDQQVNAPSGGFITSYVRIEAGGTSTPGTTNGTVTGERPCSAVDFKTVTGDGTSINIAARALATLSGGSVSDSLVYAWAIPRTIPHS